jgi:hypothetical protein
LSFGDIQSRLSAGRKEESLMKMRLRSTRLVRASAT